MIYGRFIRLFIYQEYTTDSITIRSMWDGGKNPHRR